MKKILLQCLLGVFAISCQSTGKIVPEDYSIPKYETKTLSNGLEILLIPDGKVPFFSMSLLIKSGSGADPKGKEGVSYLVAELMNKGNKKRKAVQIAETLDFLGLNFTSMPGKETSLYSIDGLSKYSPEMVDLFSDMLLDVQFSPEELRRAKKKFLAGIKTKKDDPSSFAEQAFDSYLFGDHPFGRPAIGTLSSMGRISQKDVLSYYRENYIPNRSVLAVVGAYDDALIEKLSKRFGEWKAGTKNKVDFKKPQEKNGLSIQLIEKDSLKQSQVRIGHLGPSRKIEEFFALRVANTILGGGFSSRLMDQIRDNRGLTYGISSNYEFGNDLGSFTIASSTRNDKVGELVEESLSILSEYQKNGPTKEEVERSKNFLLGNFPKAIETSEKLAFNLLVLKSYDLDDSYLRNYVKNVESLDRSTVHQAIKKYLHPSHLKVLVYGPKNPVHSQLKKLGPVEVVQPK